MNRTVQQMLARDTVGPRPSLAFACDPGSRTAFVRAVAHTPNDSITIRRWPVDYSISQPFQVNTPAARKHETQANADQRLVRSVSDLLVDQSAGYHWHGAPSLAIEDNAELPSSYAGGERRGGRTRARGTLFRMGVTYGLVLAGIEQAAERVGQRWRVEPISSSEWMSGGAGRIPKHEETLANVRIFARSCVDGNRRAYLNVDHWSEDALMALGLLNYFMWTWRV